MATKILTKHSKKQKRWQITFPKNSQLDEIITSLEERFKGMSLVEITKLALIELNRNQKIVPTEKRKSNLGDLSQNEFRQMLEETREIGKKAFANHGLDVENMTDEDAYNFFKSI